MKKDKKPKGKRPFRIRPAIPLILGACLGIFMLMFAMANDTWVIINLPGLPWKKPPVLPIVEVRLWGVILASFLGGAGTVGIIASIALLKKSRAFKAASRRVKDLENDVEKVNRLLAATPSIEQSDQDS
jgi:uncharacterized integral membrane protein